MVVLPCVLSSLFRLRPPQSSHEVIRRARGNLALSGNVSRQKSWHPAGARCQRSKRITGQENDITREIRVMGITIAIIVGLALFAESVWHHGIAKENHAANE
jgi:hypothetical protein